MLGNASSAVRQQRHEARDSLDDFPTPPWAVRALVEQLQDLVGWDPARIWEPAANRGALLRGLDGVGATIRASDVHDYGAGYEVHDFLMPTEEPEVDCVITNPPFRLAPQFARRGLEVVGEGGLVALLVRSAFTEGAERYRTLFEPFPPLFVMQFCERVIMHKGVLRDPDVAYWDAAMNGGGGGWRRPSTATSYCWIVWDRPTMRIGLETCFRWIAPCRKRLTRPGDYLPLESGEDAA